MTSRSRRTSAKATPSSGAALATAAGVGTGAWIILPTYNEAENVRGISAAILDALPGSTLLIVDDGSPDGTGAIADELAAGNPRIRVRHRPAKQGLGRAYLDGFSVAIAGGAQTIIQMDADWSHDPTALPTLVQPIAEDQADLVIGSRYAPGGGVVDWGLGRRVISRGGSLFAKTVLRLGPSDLTGGFKAWRRTTLEGIPFAGVHAGGYVFQIEMTFRASRRGARIHEVPITFRDRRIGQSKMSRRIVVEALVVVVALRAEELVGRLIRRRGGSDPASVPTGPSSTTPAAEPPPVPNADTAVPPPGDRSQAPEGR
jgi:dolichol-phosphate mannosyltransferase